MDDAEKAALGARIRQAVVRSGLSQEEIARRLKARGFPVTSGHLRRWMGGKHAPRINLLMNFAEVTGQDAEWLFGAKKRVPGYSSSELPANHEQAVRFGEWMLALPDDVRAFTFFIGELLAKPGGLAHFAEIAAGSLARMEQSSSEPAGTSRKRKAAANSGSKASGR